MSGIPGVISVAVNFMLVSSLFENHIQTFDFRNLTVMNLVIALLL